MAKEDQIKRQPSINKTNFKVIERVTEKWLNPVVVTLELSDRVMNWGNLGDDMEENKEQFTTIWSKAHESIIQRFWFLQDIWRL